MTEKQRQAIEKHGRKLLVIFPGCEVADPVELCRKLRQIEREGERCAVDYCNGVIDSDGWEKASARILGKLDNLLRFRLAKVPVFLNGDPRGYSLKIDDAWVRAHDVAIHRDMGGYGIIAPEIDKNGE